MPSAYSVPMASDVLPDPDTPTTATVRHSGTSTSISRRLLCRAPRTPMTVGRVGGTETSPVATQVSLGPCVSRHHGSRCQGQASAEHHVVRTGRHARPLGCPHLPKPRPHGRDQPSSRGGDGCACLVDVQQPAVQTAVLVQVAAGALDPPRVLDAADLHRIEPGGGDEPLGRVGGAVVVGGVEQHRATRAAIRVIRERTGAAVARSPSSPARAWACDWSRAASTTRSPPRTRSRASPLPIWPTPIIAVVMAFLLPIRLLAEVDLAVMRDGESP